jgi:hypothetical protein
MPESKYMKWNQGFGSNAEQEPKVKDTTVPVNEPAANDADGWQQYRRWIGTGRIRFAVTGRKSPMMRRTDIHMNFVNQRRQSPALLFSGSSKRVVREL